MQNFNIAELSLQRSVYGSAYGEYKRGCSSFRSYENLPHQFQHWNTVVGRRDRRGWKNRSKHQTSTQQNSFYKDSFVDLLVGNSRGDVFMSYVIKLSPTGSSAKTQQYKEETDLIGKIGGNIKLQRSRTPSIEIHLWICW